MEDGLKRRRSSFFQRRQSICTDFPESAINRVIDCKAKEESELSRLINKFKNEKRDWNELYQKLKKENSELKQKSPTVIDHHSSWEQLAPEDKQFLQGQVDYVKLSRLLDSTAEAVALRQHRTTATAIKLINLAEDYHQRNVDFTNAIIDRSLNSFDEFDLCLDYSSEDNM